MGGSWTCIRVELWIEDVLHRYVTLPENDRAGVIKDMESFITSLKKLKRESKTVVEIDNSGADNTNLEELKHEINSLQYQLHLVEERLRLFEPELVGVPSLHDLERSECFLIDALSRVAQRRKYLTDGTLPILDEATALQILFDSTEPAYPSTYPGDMASWVHDGVADTEQIYGSTSEPLLGMPCAEDPIILGSYVDPTIFDPIQHGNAYQPDMGCQLSVSADMALPPWQSDYTSTELLSPFLPPAPNPPFMQSQPLNATGTEFDAMMDWDYKGEAGMSYPYPVVSGPIGEPMGFDEELAAIVKFDVQ